jgi:hypothetical protein
MSDHGQHCPFLNRSDDRCSTNFSLERLNSTYDYCFGEYATCPVYLELLLERRVRRMGQKVVRWEAEKREPVMMAQATTPLTRGGRRIEAA